MKKNSIFLVNSTHKTKTWWTFLSVFIFVFVPFLILWLLVCEFNLLDANWLIAKNASVWHGVVTQGNIQTLASKYGIFYDGGSAKLLADLSQVIGQGKSILSNRTFFNPIVLAPIFGIFAWAIAYPIIFNAAKVSGLDVLPFSVGTGGIMIGLIISGLIPHWDNLDALYWIVRILISFLFGVIIFIACNAIVNKYLASRSYSTDIYFGYKLADAATSEQRQQLKDNIDIFKKNKDKEPSYVDVEQKDK